MKRETSKQASKQTNKQTNKQTSKQANKQTNKQTVTLTTKQTESQNWQKKKLLNYVIMSLNMHQIAILSVPAKTTIWILYLSCVLFELLANPIRTSYWLDAMWCAEIVTLLYIRRKWILLPFSFHSEYFFYRVIEMCLAVFSAALVP